MAAAVTLPPWLSFPTQLFNDSLNRVRVAWVCCPLISAFTWSLFLFLCEATILSLKVPLYSLSFYSGKLRGLPQISLLKECVSKSPAWDLCGCVGGKGNGGFRVIWLASFLVKSLVSMLSKLLSWTWRADRERLAAGKHVGNVSPS